MTDPDDAAADAAARDAARPDATARSSGGRDPDFDAVQAALKDLEDDDSEDLEDPESLTEEQRQHFVERFGE